MAHPPVIVARHPTTPRAAVKRLAARYVTGSLQPRDPCPGRYASGLISLSASDRMKGIGMNWGRAMICYHAREHCRELRYIFAEAGLSSASMPLIPLSEPGVCGGRRQSPVVKHAAWVAASAFAADSEGGS